MKELKELIQAWRDMLTDLTGDDDNDVRAVGDALEADVDLVKALSERESVVKFSKELEDVLLLPNKEPLAALLAALIVRPKK